MAEEATNQRLLIIIARNASAFDELITGLLDVGITGATIVESKGMGAILRQDMPMYAGLASLLPQHTGSRVILCVTTDENITRLKKYLDELPPEDQPLGVVLPVSQAFGPLRP